MTPFWRTFCFDVSNYGKNAGAVFFITCFCVVFIPAATIWLMGQMGACFPWVAGWFGVMMVVFAIRAILRARRNRTTYIIQPMAREEIRRARSKLIMTQPSKRL